MKSWATTFITRLAYLGGMIVFGAVAGLTVKWLSKPLIVQEWIASGAPLWPVDTHDSAIESMVYGAIYSVGLWSTILGVRRVAYRYIPLRNVWNVLMHMSMIGGAVVLIFLLLKQLDPYICIWILGDVPGDEPDGLITIFTMGAALHITIALYLIDFYRDLQRTKRTVLVAELRALRAQINPHFLFNTLNSIAALIHSRPNEAEHVVEELADLFRYTLRASQFPTVSLAEELTATNRYLAIEKARFRDRMTVIQKVDDKILDARVPSLLIQPLVENAVKHGVSKTEDHCAIYLEIRKVKSTIYLSVQDTGPGFSSLDPKEVYPRGTGLANVRDRLNLHFGEQSTCRLLADGIEIIFPYRVESDNKKTNTVSEEVSTA